MGSLLSKAPTIRDPKGTSSEGVKNPQLLSREMMGICMKILLSMSLFSERRVGEKAILIPRYKNIQEWEAAIDLFFHGELNCRGPAVEVIKERSNSSGPWGQMTLVSSTHLFQSLGRRRAEDKALASKSSIKIFATIGERGEPMETPQVCSKNSPSKQKNVEVR